MIVAQDIKANAPQEFKPKIHIVYPPNNFTEFERWFGENYSGCNTERLYLDIYFTGYLVNKNYAKQNKDVPELQKYVDSLDRSKKYFTVVQYDLGTVVDLKDLDCLQFNMSIKDEKYYQLPLIGEASPYLFNEPKKYLANFIGAMTHPIREHARILSKHKDYYISFQWHNAEDYCRIIAQSVFTLCYRGFGKNSFRISEALQYGSIPVYISDEFIEPHNIDFNYYGIKVHESKLHGLDELLRMNNSPFNPLNYFGKEAYEKYYTYSANKNLIIKHLESVD